FSGRLRSICRQQDSVGETVDIDHRTAIVAVANDRKTTGLDHREEARLPSGLLGTIEPGRADDRDLGEVLVVRTREQPFFHYLLGPPLAHIRILVRLLVNDI